MSASLETLFHPLQSGALSATGRTLFIGAQAYPLLATLRPDVWQPFKPLAEGLAGLNRLEHIPEDGSYDLVLVNIPKQVEEAKHWIASGLYALKSSGILVAAAANDANGARLSKWAKDLGLPFEADSRNKAKVISVSRPATLPALVADWRHSGQKQKVQIGDGITFLSQPGVFGWDKIDDGSALLAAHLPADLKGIVADFGAGTGYLSGEILKRCAGVSALWLAEADARALDCAKENLENVRGMRTLEYLWADLTKPAALPPLDAIVMNPPFHLGKKTENALGLSFLQTAAHHLKKGGRLYVVANAHLPYEQTLRDRFAQLRLLAQDGGFKVYEAVK